MALLVVPYVALALEKRDYLRDVWSPLQVRRNTRSDCFYYILWSMMLTERGKDCLRMGKTLVAIVSRQGNIAHGHNVNGLRIEDL